MKCLLSYPTPQLLTVTGPTSGRREDTDRGTLWTDTEVDWLIQHYGRFPVSFCANRLRRSELSVRIKAHRVRRGIKMGSVKRFTINTTDQERAAS